MRFGTHILEDGPPISLYIIDYFGLNYNFREKDRITPVQLIQCRIPRDSSPSGKLVYKKNQFQCRFTFLLCHLQWEDAKELWLQLEYIPLLEHVILL